MTLKNKCERSEQGFLNFVRAQEVHQVLVQIGKYVSIPFVSIAEATEVEDFNVRAGGHVGVGELLTVGVVPDTNVPKYIFQNSFRNIAEAAEVEVPRVHVGRHVGAGGLLTVGVVPAANVPNY